jgi:hypothetical protein
MSFLTGRREVMVSLRGRLASGGGGLSKNEDL